MFPRVLCGGLLPKISVPEEGPITAERLFGEDCPLHFEIGFGGGEHLAYRADLLPNHGFIGAEPFLNGVAQALTHVEEQRLANIRLHAGDALNVLSRVPDGALTMAYLLHPDPWPKARHAKRRMMNDGPVRMIADRLKPGGEFRFGTDHAVYLRHALMVMHIHDSGFRCTNSARGGDGRGRGGSCVILEEKSVTSDPTPVLT